MNNFVQEEVVENCTNCLHQGDYDNDRCVKCIYCPRPPGYYSLVIDQLENLWEMR